MSGKKRLTPETRRAVIVSAALEVFADAGYDRASMRAVARAAGITTPVLYDHFDSKADAIAAWWWGNRDLSKDQIVELTSDLLWRGLGHVTGEPHDRR